MKNKKGVSNLEMILSFLIFIGFVFALFLIFPIAKTERSKVGLDAAHKGILEFASVELTEFSVDIDKSSLASKSCFRFKSPTKLEKIIVRNKDNLLMNAVYEDNRIYIEGTEKFYYISSSEEFEERNFPKDCKELGLGNFEIGLISTSKVLSFKKASELKEAYSLKYSDLQAKFGIPARENFGFILREFNGTEIISAMKKKPLRVSVLVKETPVRIVYSNGELKYIMLHVEEW